MGGHFGLGRIWGQWLSCSYELLGARRLPIGCLMRWCIFPSKDVLHVLNFGLFWYFLGKWPWTCLGVTNFPKSDIKHQNIHSFIRVCAFVSVTCSLSASATEFDLHSRWHSKLTGLFYHTSVVNRPQVSSLTSGKNISLTSERHILIVSKCLCQSTSQQSFPPRIISLSQQYWISSCSVTCRTRHRASSLTQEAFHRKALRWSEPFYVKALNASSQLSQKVYLCLPRRYMSAAHLHRSSTSVERTAGVIVNG